MTFRAEYARASAQPQHFFSTALRSQIHDHMTNSSGQSMPQSPRRLKHALAWFLGAGFIGFLDSLYLAITHFIGSPVTCGFFTGCDVVTSSIYSSVAGIPIALFGALYYLFWVLLGVWFLDSRNTLFLILLPLILIGIQLFIIDAICVYCMISAASSTALFVLSFVIRNAGQSETPAITYSSAI